ATRRSMASRITSATGKSMSATQAGITSGGTAAHLMPSRAATALSDSASRLLIGIAHRPASLARCGCFGQAHHADRGPVNSALKLAEDRGDLTEDGGLVAGDR